MASVRRAWSWLSGFSFVLFLLAGSSASSPAAVLDSIAPETITDRVTAANGFAWRYGFDIGLGNDGMLVKVAVNLIPAQGVTRVEIDRVIPAWKKGIERIWSRRFALSTPAGQHYPIVMEVAFKGSVFHHDVIVRPYGGRIDELNWNISDSPEVIAHEFGHMLGLYDEYPRGALDPESGTIDRSSIMSANLAGGTSIRHYRRFRSWFIDKTGINDVVLFGLKRP